MIVFFMIPWGHHIQIINKCKGNLDKALFFSSKKHMKITGQELFF